MAAQHLVLHLHPIPWIEELMAGKRLVLHGLGVGVQGTSGAERRGLRVFLGRPSSGHVNSIMYIARRDVKGILA